MSTTILAVRERPIIFSGPMIRALLDGRKTQTRRVVKGKWAREMNISSVTARRHQAACDCPFGQSEDRLWVRETCRAHEITTKEAEADAFGHMERLAYEIPPYGLDGVIYRADGAFREIDNTQAAANAWGELRHSGRRSRQWTPSIFMPRWASRILLEITDVRVERLQDIRHNGADLEAEGIELGPSELFPHTNRADKLARHFKNLWDSLNARRGYGWNVNPWIWAITFRRITP